MSAPTLSSQPASIWRLLSLWGPVVIVIAAIQFGSSMSSPPETAGVSDKTLHTAAFALLALLLLRALAGATWHGVTRWTLLGCCAISVLYGAQIEWQQMYIPGRTPELMDIAADFAGAASAAIAAGAWSIIRRL